MITTEPKAKDERTNQASDKPHRFTCHDCGSIVDFDADKSDPTSSKGCCKNCGSANWTMVDKGSGENIA